MAEKPEDFNLPTSVVSRIVKESLPDGVNVSKEARAALSKAASIFVLYATSCANNFAIQANRKTLTGHDIFSALKEMEFERFIEPLTEHLEAYKQDKANKTATKKKAEKEKEQTPEVLTVEDDESE